MSEVWKAYDPKRQRTVAIKVLKDQMFAGALRPALPWSSVTASGHLLNRSGLVPGSFQGGS